MSRTIDTVVVGATGYVGGELLRLIAGHPQFNFIAALSTSAAGSAIAATFPQLAPSYPGQVFTAPAELEDLIADCTQLAIFCAAPHGSAAKSLADLLAMTNTAGIDTHIVDASADFRFNDAGDYAAVYGAHGAPELLAEFSSGIPEQVHGVTTRHIGNPGCFATAMLLAVTPLLKSALVETQLFATGVTGSTGSGKTPVATTHHPLRNSNLFAYKPLAHRHAPEVVALAEQASGVRASLAFVPHSGPFARGIHLTTQATLKNSGDGARVADYLREYYRDSEFVQLLDSCPRIKDVVGSNYAQLSVSYDEHTVAVFSVIDNLVKGAAGGAVQWMNRLFDLPDACGLTAPAIGWT